MLYIDPAPWGHVAEWLRNGLQNRVHQFNSGRGLHLFKYLEDDRGTTKFSSAFRQKEHEPQQWPAPGQKWLLLRSFRWRLVLSQTNAWAAA